MERKKLAQNTKKAIFWLSKAAAAIDPKDLFFFFGLALLGAGIWQIYPPLALIVVGAILVWLATWEVMRNVNSRKSSREPREQR